MLNKKAHNISLDELLKTKKISVRAYNCCENAQLGSLYDIVSYYKMNWGFMNIRSSGKTTNQELINLCRIEFPQVMETMNLLKKMSDPQLTFNQYLESLENVDHGYMDYIELKYTKLLNQCTNKIKTILLQLTFPVFIKSFLYANKKKLLKIRNVRSNSANRLMDFQLKLRIFLEDFIASEITPSQLNYAIAVCKYGDICTSKYVREIIEEKNHIPMLWILQQFIRSSDNVQIKIITEGLPVFNDFQKIRLVKIGQKYNYTRERVRQIHSYAVHKLFELKSEAVRNQETGDFVGGYPFFKFQSDWKYLLDKFNDIDYINEQDKIVKNILKQENSSFSGTFLLQIIAFFLKNNYTLFGGIDRSRKNIWKNAFLISNVYPEIFDFERARGEIEEIVINSDMNYLLDVEEYVINSKSWIQYDFSKIKKISKIIRNIFFYEFGQNSESKHGLVRIKAARRVNVAKVVYGILKKNGAPMHLNDIFVEFKKLYPSHRFTEPIQLKSGILHHKDITYRNMKSLYTLIEWKQIKSGTIRGSIIEYLSKNDDPMTLNNITEHILQFFPDTNGNSIKSSMKNDTKNRFSIFEGNRFGLKDKIYPPEYKQRR
jgi:hypothetical protein